MKTQMATLAAVFIIAVSTPLLAHHSLATLYDASKMTRIEGVITKVEWLNPHVWITIDGKGADGKIVSWRVQIAAPAALKKTGFDKNLIELTRTYSMEVWPAMDGSTHAGGRTLTFADGRTFDVSDKWPEFSRKK